MARNVRDYIVKHLCGYPDQVIQVANRPGSGVAKAFLEKAVLPDARPFVRGAYRAARRGLST